MKTLKYAPTYTKTSVMAQVLWNSDIDVYNKDKIPLPIARRIAGYLPVKDLLSFSLVSRNTFEAASDPKLWVSLLKALGAWSSAKPLTKEVIKQKNQKMDYLDDPLRCLDYVYRSPKNARYQVLKIHKCLAPFYYDIVGNKSYDKLRIFKEYQTPEEQAKLLTNMMAYNRIDYIEDSRAIGHEKLSELFEIFENALLRELEIHFDLEDYEKTRQFVMILVSLKNLQTLIDFFLQKSIFDGDEEKFSLTPNEVEQFFKDEQLDLEAFGKFFDKLANVFNEQCAIIDLIFPQSVPMMYKVCEELISNKLTELILVLTEASKKYGLYLQTVPFIYQELGTTFIDQLQKSENCGESYHQLVQELIDMLFESFAAEYMREEVLQCKTLAKVKVEDWNESITKREAETSSRILDSIKIESKNDFLTSFKSVFTLGLSKDDTTKEKISEMQAKAKILSENIKSLDKIFSPEVVLDLLNNARLALARLLTFRDFSISSLRSDIFQSVQDIFMEVMDVIELEHLRPGFDKALTYLQTYNPNSPTYTTEHNEKFAEPLVMFFDLINMADVIIQMVEIFYKEEIVHKQLVKNENSILNPSLQSKKKLEALVDKNVADGLNIGIEILVHQIEISFQEYLLDTDYCPAEGATPLTMANFGPTDAAQKATNILEENMDLLTGSADKSVVDVFQQEIAERFFQTVVKLIKKRSISVLGATNLISDLNLYYEFIVQHIRTNKRLVVPLYLALKKIGNLYLISGDDSKAIGKLVSDLSKFNGIFSQEDIYEFVQRRQDWPLIKRHVEKVMYGFGMGECKFM